MKLVTLNVPIVKQTPVLNVKDKCLLRVVYVFLTVRLAPMENIQQGLVKYVLLLDVQLVTT